MHQSVICLSRIYFPKFLFIYECNLLPLSGCYWFRKSFTCAGAMFIHNFTQNVIVTLNVVIRFFFVIDMFVSWEERKKTFQSIFART